MIQINKVFEGLDWFCDSFDPAGGALGAAKCLPLQGDILTNVFDQPVENTGKFEQKRILPELLEENVHKSLLMPRVPSGSKHISPLRLAHSKLSLC